MTNLKADVDIYGGPAHYPKRVILVGALNELPLGPRDEAEPLRPHEIKSACSARDYLAQFEFGKIGWLGPGDEKVWSYNIPFKWGHEEGCWNVQAQAYMRILQQSGHVFLNPCFALSQLRQVREGENVHFDANHVTVLSMMRIVTHANIVLTILDVWHQLKDQQPHYPEKI